MPLLWLLNSTADSWLNIWWIVIYRHIDEFPSIIVPWIVCEICNQILPNIAEYGSNSKEYANSVYY